MKKSVELKNQLEKIGELNEHNCSEWLHITRALVREFFPDEMKLLNTPANSFVMGFSFYKTEYKYKKNSYTGKKEMVSSFQVFSEYSKVSAKNILLGMIKVLELRESEPRYVPKNNENKRLKIGAIAITLISVFGVAIATAIFYAGVYVGENRKNKFEIKLEQNYNELRDSISLVNSQKVSNNDPKGATTANGNQNRNNNGVEHTPKDSIDKP